MEKIDQCFLAALRAALRGEQTDPELSREEWIALLNLAHTHKVLPLILDAVHAAPSFQSLGDAALQQLRRQVRQQVMLQSVRTEEFLALNRALREAGIRPLVVKGLICRELYPKPDYRLSGDEDVLVEPELFARCCEMMAGLGLYGVDTVLLVVFALVLLENPASCLLEVLIHCLILALLFFAFQAAERLSKIPRRRRPQQPPQE